MIWVMEEILHQTIGSSSYKFTRFHAYQLAHDFFLQHNSICEQQKSISKAGVVQTTRIHKAGRIFPSTLTLLKSIFW